MPNDPAATGGGIPKFLPVIVLSVEIILIGCLQLLVGGLLGCSSLHGIAVARGIITVIYLGLICGGLHVGNLVVLEILYDKPALINPSLRHIFPGFIFLAHFVIRVIHVTILGPIFIARGLRSWYWASLVAMLFGSLPIVPNNYNTESFGKWVGTFVVFRNLFELLVSLVLASYNASWKLMYVYHFWIWGYRLLDVGPRRLMRSAKWQSRNMLIVLVVLYIAVPILLWYNMVVFAGTEPCTNSDTSAKENAFSAGGRILYCTVAYLGFFVLQRKHLTEVANTEGKFPTRPPAPTYEEYRNDNYTQIK
jgi:hypothetical protein